MQYILAWIDINQQLPGFKQECIIQFENGEVQGGWLYGGQARNGHSLFIESHAEYEVAQDVVYWMALPPAMQTLRLAYPKNPGKQSAD